MNSSVDRESVRRKFEAAVNMNAREIEVWLGTAESCRVGFKRDGATESVGHASGRRILAILSKPVAALTDDDYKHMRKVVGYIRRHRAQRPENIYTSRWRYSLLNWGHDPLKEPDA